MQQTSTTLREITAAEAYRHVDLRALVFTTTADLEPLATMVGQERALQALHLGLGIPQQGYHIFVAGPASAGVRESILSLVREHARSAPTPGDWVYVQNFRAPDHPQAIPLDPGQGQRLREDMARLVAHVRAMLPQALRQERCAAEQQVIEDTYTRATRRLLEAFGRMAHAEGFAIAPDLPDDIVLIPLHGDRPMTPEEFAHLSKAQRQDLEQRQELVLHALQSVLQQHRQLLEQLAADLRQVERHCSASLLGPMMAALKQEHPQAQVHYYLDAVQDHMLAHLDQFKAGGSQGGRLSPDAHEGFLAYTVHVVVDNSDSEGAPVLVEDIPSYTRLFGTIERVVDAHGRVVTHFSRITAGALLRASGGYVVFNLDDALTEPFVWKTLKRVLQSQLMQTDTYDPWALFSLSALQPDMIPIQTKVIVLGSPWLYDLLSVADPDFAQIFKITADVGEEMDNTAAHQASYAHFLASLCRQESLRHFDRSAVEAVVEYGMRAVADQQKLASHLGLIADLAREASYAAGQAGAAVVIRTHVAEAIQARHFLANRAEVQLQERIHRGTLLIETTGRRVGHINSMAVVQLGAYAFGRPFRVTATAALGHAGIVNIEREAKLSGGTHDKGVFILRGYLHQMYAQDTPLTLSASLCCEQSYSGMEGDQASASELAVLLSCLAHLPLRQDLAVIGAVNQQGEIQAIGGVNEAIEGFYDVCVQRGLTGQQGVLIPQANVRHLMLRADVVEAIRQGRFHVYAIAHIDQGLELLTGTPAGDLMTAGTVHSLVHAQVHQFATAMLAFRPDAHNGTRPRPHEGLAAG